MFRNYLHVALKNIFKSKLNFSINVVGLAIGIASCVIILLYVVKQLSYDDYHRDIERIYRVALWKDVGNLNKGNASVPYRTAEVLLEEYPEVEQAGRFTEMFNQEAIVRIGDQLFKEDRFYFAEQNLLNVLTIPFLKGDPKTALNQPNSVIVTERTARKYFGRTNVVGQTIVINLNETNTDYKITGILKDCPENTHFKYDVLATLDNYFPLLFSPFKERMKTWYVLRFWTYVKLTPGTDATEFEAKLNQVIESYFPATRQDSQFFLQPAKDIHLHSNHDNEIEPNNDVIYIYIFSAISILVLIIACINFMNLTTARSIHRAKEVGLRKVLGAARQQLIRQFLFESVLTTSVAVLVAGGFIELFLVLLNRYAGIAIEANYFSAELLLSGGVLILAVGFFSGLYPAFFLSAFQPIKTLRGAFASSASGKTLRMTLVVIQMVITVILLVGIVTISEQLDFIRNKKLGFEKDQVLLIKTLGTALMDGQNYETFKNRLLQHSEVKGVTKNVIVMGQGASMRSVYFNNVSEDEKVAVPYLTVGHDFAKTYGLELLSGRDISRDFPSDTNHVYLVNEAAVKQYDLVPAVGREIASGDLGLEKGQIVGVVKDFHYAPLHQPIGPLVIGLWDRPLGYISIRLQTGSLTETMAEIENTWKEIEVDRTMDFSFLDDQLTATYQFETMLGRIITAFTGLAIFIASLGLFGMALYASEQRTREIAIRKVLGASVRRIVFSFSFDFVRLMLIANLIAWPVAYLFLRQWLNDFAYRIDISMGVFFLAGAITLITALGTVAYQSIKVALTNPTNSLKYE